MIFVSERKRFKNERQRLEVLFVGLVVAEKHRAADGNCRIAAAAAACCRAERWCHHGRRLLLRRRRACLSRREKKHHLDFFFKHVVAVMSADHRHVRAERIVAGNARKSELWTQPLCLELVGKPAVKHRRPRNLGKVDLGELPEASRDRIFFHERGLGVMKLQRVVRGKRHVQATAEEEVEGVARVVEEQAVVGKRRDANANLSQVEKILEHRKLL